MFRKVMTLVASVSLVAPGVAQAAPRADGYVLQAMPTGQVSVRYSQGEMTLSLPGKQGMVQLRPMPSDRGRLSFGIAVYNDGGTPANFDVTDISVRVGGQPVAVLSYDELIRQAKRRAAWSQFGLVLAGGLAAGLAASQRDTYTATTYTRRGTYRTVYSAPSPAAGIQAAAIVAGTGAGVASIQNRLDRTIDTLGDEIVQLNTVDPGESYAARIVLAKARFKVPTNELWVTVRWNGEDYPFLFRIAKPGTPAPIFPVLAPASDATPAGAPIPVG